MPFVPCGDCIDCNTDNSWQCSQGDMLGLHRNGAFTQFVKLPSSQLHLIKNNLSDKLNTFAEPVAASLSVLQAPLYQKQAIWVCGTGRIANLCAFILRENGYSNITQGLTPPSNSFDALILIQQPQVESESDCAEKWIENLIPDGLIVIKTRTPDKLFIPINLLVKKRLRIHAVNYAPISESLEFIEKYADFFEGLTGPVFQLEDYVKAFTESQKNIEKKIFLEIQSPSMNKPYWK